MDRTGNECFFVTDIHGSEDRCRKLFELIAEERPQALFWGGDILPSAFHDLTSDYSDKGNFIESFLIAELEELRRSMVESYPEIFLIMGNDDPLIYEESIKRGDKAGLFTYVHNRKIDAFNSSIFGYAYIPPTPFQLKDWEKYDVSRHTDHGSVSPEQGFRTAPSENPRFETIEKDLVKLAGEEDISKAIFLFHSPPYQTMLDRADLDGKIIDHVPLDVNVGSIAIRRFIEDRQPLLTLHGHIHESTRLTGSWRDKIGRTHMFNAAHDGPELAVVKFHLNDLENATRELI